jgi:hypothetical protein
MMHSKITASYPYSDPMAYAKLKLSAERSLIELHGYNADRAKAAAIDRL